MNRSRRADVARDVVRRRFAAGAVLAVLLTSLAPTTAYADGPPPPPQPGPCQRNC